MIVEPRTATERTAYVMLRLAAGERLTTMQVASACHLSRQGSYRLLDSMSRVVPLVLDDGKWGLLRQGEGD
jgi:hypothetical protein